MSELRIVDLKEQDLDEETVRVSFEVEQDDFRLELGDVICSLAKDYGLLTKSLYVDPSRPKYWSRAATHADGNVRMFADCTKHSKAMMEDLPSDLIIALAEIDLSVHAEEENRVFFGYPAEV